MPNALDATTAAPAVTPEQEAAVDASIDAALDKAGIGGEEPARTDEGKFAPKVEAKPEAKVEPVKAPKVEAPAKEPAPTKREPDAEMQKALDTLRRSKSFDKLIPKMSREELVEAAAIERQRQSVSDDISRRLGQFSEPRETTQSDTESTHGREPSAEQPEVDNLRSVQPLLKSLGLDGDKDAEKSLHDFARTIAGQVASGYAPLNAEVAYLRGEVAESVGESMRQELVASGRYPEFESRETWYAVEAKATELLPSPAYAGNNRKALTDATRILFGDGQPLLDPAERTRRERARANGNPDLPTSSTRERPKTPDAALDSDVDRVFAAHGLT